MGPLNSALCALAVVVLFLTLCFVGFIVRKRLTPHQLPLPPGPKGLPFLGSALEINKNEPWVTFGEWKKTYGEIVSCTLLGQTYIVINSERAAKALLEQRSNIYSDRQVIQTSTLFGMDFNTGHRSYGDTWSAHRKMFHRGFDKAIIHKYHDSVTQRARALLENLLQSPEKFENHLKMFAVSIIMSVTYGYDVAPKDDPFVAPIEEVEQIVVVMTPERAALLDLFPQLLNFPAWFPGAGLKRLAKRCRELSPQIRDAPFQFVKECLAKDVENESVVAQLLQAEAAEAQDRESYEQNIKDFATSSLLAGASTTQTTLTTLILAMILYPEVQEHAQAIIDRVVGRDRLPTTNDRGNLQYIDALLRETMRWGSLVPMAIPHVVTKDDIFEWCLIPKGSVIIPNLWGMARDEERFPDPTVLKPERHLDGDGNLLPDDISGLYFGYGHRICPGRYLADASIWLAAVNILFMFSFRRAIGPAGYEIDIFPKFTGGVVL
ncbi:cytochrome P450 [Boletus coccyginus]|nr:cytochrome P450 [Boletus coccyginus]